MSVQPTHSWTGEDARCDRAFCWRLRCTYSRAYLCNVYALSGGQRADCLASSRRLDGTACCAYARRVRPNYRGFELIIGTPSLADAQSMPDLSADSIARACFRAVSIWSVRAALDALAHRCISGCGSSSDLSSDDRTHAEYRGESAFLAGNARRTCGCGACPTVSLSAYIHSVAAAANQMGGLWPRSANRRAGVRKRSGAVISGA